MRADSEVEPEHFRGERGQKKIKKKKRKRCLHFSENEFEVRTAHMRHAHASGLRSGVRIRQYGDRLLLLRPSVVNQGLRALICASRPTCQRPCCEHILAKCLHRTRRTPAKHTSCILCLCSSLLCYRRVLCTVSCPSRRIHYGCRNNRHSLFPLSWRRLPS